MIFLIGLIFTFFKQNHQAKNQPGSYKYKSTDPPWLSEYVALDNIYESRYAHANTNKMPNAFRNRNKMNFPYKQIRNYPKRDHKIKFRKNKYVLNQNGILSSLKKNQQLKHSSASFGVHSEKLSAIKHDSLNYSKKRVAPYFFTVKNEDLGSTFMHKPRHFNSNQENSIPKALLKNGSKQQRDNFVKKNADSVPSATEQNFYSTQRKPILFLFQTQSSKIIFNAVSKPLVFQPPFLGGSNIDYQDMFNIEKATFPSFTMTPINTVQQHVESSPFISFNTRKPEFMSPGNQNVQVPTKTSSMPSNLFQPHQIAFINETKSNPTFIFPNAFQKQQLTSDSKSIIFVPNAFKQQFINATSPTRNVTNASWQQSINGSRPMFTVSNVFQQQQLVNEKNLMSFIPNEHQKQQSASISKPMFFVPNENPLFSNAKPDPYQKNMYQNNSASLATFIASSNQRPTIPYPVQNPYVFQQHPSWLMNSNNTFPINANMNFGTNFPTRNETNGIIFNQPAMFSKNIPIWGQMKPEVGTIVDKAPFNNSLSDNFAFGRLYPEQLFTFYKVGTSAENQSTMVPAVTTPLYQTLLKQITRTIALKKWKILIALAVLFLLLLTILGISMLVMHLVEKRRMKFSTKKTNTFTLLRASRKQQKELMDKITRVKYDELETDEEAQLGYFSQ